MRILICHGFLLRITGSNIYVSNLTRSLVKLGHDVLILCQDPHADELDFVTEFIGEKIAIKMQKKSPYQGTCTIIQPDIGGLLPVYVLDHYEGFKEVKTLLEISKEERNNYIEKNSLALKKACNDFKPDVVMTHHAVLQPYIASQTLSQIPYYCYIHGSAIEYVIKKDKTYLPYAIEGLQHAKKILVGSSYMAEEVQKLFSDSIKGLKEKTVILPCGVDLDRFSMDRDVGQANDHLKKSMKKKKGKAISENHMDHLYSKISAKKKVLPNLIDQEIKNCQKKYNYLLVEEDFRNLALDVHSHLTNPNCLQLFYLGKLIPQKGVHLILATFMEALAQDQDLHLTLTAFGKYREHLALMVRALQKGNRNLLDQILKLDPFFEDLRRYYAHQKDEYFDKLSHHPSIQKISQRILFTGKLQHEELSNVLPFMDILFMPSLLPEAFGLVAIEAMACGVFPVMSYFSGMKDIVDTASKYLDPNLMNLMKIDMENPLLDLQKRFPALLDLARKKDASLRNTLRKIVAENFTWNSVANQAVGYFN